VNDRVALSRTHDGCSATNLLIQPRRLSVRLDAQLIHQGAPAGLVLSYRQGPLPVQHQQAHQLPLPGLMPGFQLHLPPGIGYRSIVLAMHLVMRRQPPQGCKRLAAQPFPLQQQPFLESHAVAQGKSLQKAPSIQLGCFLQRGSGTSQAARKSRHVAARVPASVELDCLTGDGEEGGRCASIADHRAEVCESATQARPGRALRVVGP